LKRKSRRICMGKSEELERKARSGRRPDAPKIKEKGAATVKMPPRHERHYLLYCVYTRRFMPPESSEVMHV
jgi:hypothetical protein